MTEQPIVQNFESAPENTLEIGRLRLISYSSTMEELFELSKRILEDKTCREYLEEIKIKEKIDRNGGYLG
jgi:hypothetical protein